MTQYVIVAVYVPPEHTEAVRAAMCEAGAGTVDDGRYDHVTYTSKAVFRCRVLDGAWDQAGPRGVERIVEEERVEAVCRHDRIEAVVQAIRRAHPYEAPAITVYPTLRAGETG